LISRRDMKNKIFIMIIALGLMSCLSSNNYPILEVSESITSDSNGKVLFKSEYIYDDKGLLIEDITTYYSPSSVVKNIYIYNENNFLLSSTYLVDDKEMQTTKFEYNADSKIITQFDHYLINDVIVKSLYFYNNSFMHKREVYRNDVLIKSKIVTREELNNNIIYNNYDEKKNSNTKEVYTFNKGLISKIEYIGKSGEIISSTELTYMDNILLSKKEYGAFGELYTKYSVNNMNSENIANYNFLFENVLVKSKETYTYFK